MNICIRIYIITNLSYGITQSRLPINVHVSHSSGTRVVAEEHAGDDVIVG